MNMVKALNDGLRVEMQRDDRVVVLGEDIGTLGGVFRVTAGLLEEFGEDRVVDTPLSETGIVGAAVGMALYGLRPVSEIEFADFLYPAMDQIVNEAAKYRYRSGGEFSCPMVIRTPMGGGIKGGLYHSQSPESLLIHNAGIKVVCPSNPYDAKGLLISAIRDPDPVVFFEPKRVYRAHEMEVPDGDYMIPLSQAKVVREGADVTLVSWGAMVHTALKAAERLQAEEGLSAEVLDLRTLTPVDVEALEATAAKTGAVVIAHEAPNTGSWAAEISSLIHERALLKLRAPVRRVGGWDVRFPLSKLEKHYVPDADRLVEAVKETLAY